MQSWVASGASNASYSSWLAQSVYRASREDEGGASGVREPRRPVQPTNGAGAQLDLPRRGDDAPSYTHTVTAW